MAAEKHFRWYLPTAMSDIRHYLFVVEWLGLLSVVTFIGSLLAIPFIIARMPANYFVRHRLAVEKRHRQHPVVAKVVFIMRNCLGILFLVAGLVMLVLPGQGIITMVIGLSLMDFPGKHAVVEYLVHRPKVMKLLNWIRKKEHRPPFVF